MIYVIFNTYGHQPQFTQGTTNNLMDYADGKRLFKYQWDLVQHPVCYTDVCGGGENTAMMANVGILGCSAYLNGKIFDDRTKYQVLKASDNKLQAYYTTTDNAIKEIEVKVEIEKGSDKTKITFPANGFIKIPANKLSDISVSSLPEGKYTMTFQQGTKTTVRTFFIREKAYDFACEVCGRDLSLTLQKLKSIFNDNDNITQSYVDYLNEALKKGGFTTCKRQAHFFSQVYVESANFMDFEEDYAYRLYDINSSNEEIGIYATFGNQSNDSYKTLYNQDFWDEDKHLNHTGAPGCSHLYQKKEKCTDIKDKTKRYLGVGAVTKTRNKYTITFPESFKKDTSGTYVKYTIPDSRKCGETLFNLVYKDKNGNTQAGDGWKYRGRGAIQVTGRLNYKNTSNKCNSTFNKSFDWENNPDQLSSDAESIIYSAVAWFLNAFNPISTLDNMTVDQVTRTVNAKQLDKGKRTAKYNELINDIQLYKCDAK